MRRFLALFLGFFALAATAKPISSDIHWIPDDHFWRQGIIVVSLTKPKPAQAILDTGGVTETRAKAKSDFETYYHGLPIDMAVGADYLANHRVVLGQPSENPLSVPLDVHTQKHETVAFVSCDVGLRARLSRTYRLLLDTAALAWNASDDAHANPVGVMFVDSTVFATLSADGQSSPGQTWQIAGEDGKFHSARSLVEPAIRCGPATLSNVVIVERADNTTYAGMQKLFGVNVDGDISLGALQGSAWAIDFPKQVLEISR